MEGERGKGERGKGERELGEGGGGGTPLEAKEGGERPAERRPLASQGEAACGPRRRPPWPPRGRTEPPAIDVQSRRDPGRRDPMCSRRDPGRRDAVITHDVRSPRPERSSDCAKPVFRRPEDG